MGLLQYTWTLSEIHINVINIWSLKVWRNTTSKFQMQLIEDWLNGCYFVNYLSPLMTSPLLTHSQLRHASPWYRKHHTLNKPSLHLEMLMLMLMLTTNYIHILYTSPHSYIHTRSQLDYSSSSWRRGEIPSRPQSSAQILRQWTSFRAPLETVTSLNPIKRKTNEKIRFLYLRVNLYASPHRDNTHCSVPLVLSKLFYTVEVAIIS